MLFARESPGSKSKKDVSTTDNTASYHTSSNRKEKNYLYVFCPLFNDRARVGASWWEQ